MGFLYLIFGQFCERFSYFGTQTILVLYLIHQFAYTAQQSTMIYGVYLLFIYTMPLIGGMIGDQLIPKKLAILLGLILLLISYLLLIFNNSSIFLIGLSLNTIAIGLYKSNVTSLVGKLDLNNLLINKINNHEKAYRWFYLSINLGATLGAISYGLIIAWLNSWRSGFILGAILIAISLVNTYYALKRSVLKIDDLYSNKYKIKIIKIILVLLVLIIISILTMLDYFCLTHTAYCNRLILLLLALLFIIFCVAFWLGNYKNNKYNNKNFILLLFAFIFAMLFFSASFQIGSSVMLLVADLKQQTLWGHTVPASIWGSLYPIGVLLFAPIIALTQKFYKKNNQNNNTIFYRFSRSFIVAAIAFILLFITSLHLRFINQPMLLIIMAILLLGLAELTFFPLLLKTINDYAPLHFGGTMLGICFLFIAAGGYFSGAVPTLFLQHVHSYNSYKLLFLTIAILLISLAIITRLFNNFIYK